MFHFGLEVIPERSVLGVPGVRNCSGDTHAHISLAHFAPLT